MEYDFWNMTWKYGKILYLNIRNVKLELSRKVNDGDGN